MEIDPLNKRAKQRISIDVFGDRNHDNPQQGEESSNFGEQINDIEDILRILFPLIVQEEKRAKEYLSFNHLVVSVSSIITDIVGHDLLGADPNWGHAML
jgi:hypothetical protein